MQNAAYAIFVVSSLIFCIWLGLYQRKLRNSMKAGRKYDEMPDETRLKVELLGWGWIGSWMVAAVIVLVVGLNYSENPPANNLQATPAISTKKSMPLVVAPTNADPAAAAQHEQELLDQAKRDQQQQLKK